MQPTGYMLRPLREATHRFGYLGVPHDAATTLGNPGGRFGPQALREAFAGGLGKRLQEGRLADLDRGEIVDLGAVEVADFGDVALSYHDTEQTVEEIERSVGYLLSQGYTPLIAGGDHSISYPAIKALHDKSRGRIGIIQLDAHCDLMDFSQRQGRYSGSSGMRRALELERVEGFNFVQVGLRGYTTVEQFAIGQELGVQRISASRFGEMGVRAAAVQALAWASDGAEKIYLTIDLDVLNPGEAPGTGWPEPGGLTGQQLLDFVRIVAPRCAAVDIAELNPLFDTPARTTAVLAGRLLIDCVTARVRS